MYSGFHGNQSFINHQSSFINGSQNCVHLVYSVRHELHATDSLVIHLTHFTDHRCENCESVCRVLKKKFLDKMYFLTADGKATVQSLQVLAAAAVPRNCSHYLHPALRYFPTITKNAFGISRGRLKI